GASTDELLQKQDRGDCGGVGNSDHAVDAGGDEAGFDALTSDALDARPHRRGHTRVVVPPTGEECRVLRVRHADACGPAGVADVAGQSGGSASGAAVATTHAGSGCSSMAICSKIDSAMLLFP